MKQFLTFILILSSFICFAQKKQDVTAKVTTANATKEQLNNLSTGSINFGNYEKSKVEEHENLIKQFNQLAKNFRALDSIYWKFINDELSVNKIDFSRLSQHKDSLQITSEGIFYILKQKKK